MKTQRKPYFHDTDLCFVDSFAGLIPGKVVDSTIVEFPTGRTEQQVKVLVTSTRRGYHRGATYWFHVNDVIDRRMAYVRDGQYRIAPYNVRTSLRTL